MYGRIIERIISHPVANNGSARQRRQKTEKKPHQAVKNDRIKLRRNKNALKSG